MITYAVLITLCGLAWALLYRLVPDRGTRAPVISAPSADERRLLRDLPAALTNGEIFLAYQPKLRLRTGEVEGVEALVRWEHPTLGGIARKSLIPLAEERGRIRELTIWVLRQSLVDQAKLATSGRVISIHINVSASLLTDAEFVRDVCTLVGPATGMIGLEITETAFIENSPLALINLQRMINQGISISIDDYGSGMSSLAYLKELPAKELKIDKMFVSGMTMSHRDPLIVRSTIDLAHALGLSVGRGGRREPWRTRPAAGHGMRLCARLPDQPGPADRRARDLPGRGQSPQYSSRCRSKRAAADRVLGTYRA